MYRRDAGFRKINIRSRHDEIITNKYITDLSIRRELINYIYDTIPISKFKYKIIEYEFDLPLLKSTTYYVAPNYSGINSLLVFLKLRDHYYSYLVDRRTLSYDKNKLEIEKVNIIPIEVMLDLSIYKGTIFDGIMLYRMGPNKKKIFIVNDVYIFRGESNIKTNMYHKMLNADAYIQSFMKTSGVLNSIVLDINSLYKLKDIKMLINTYMPKSKYSTSIKGVTFYPEKSATKLIFLYNKNSEESNSSDTILEVIQTDAVFRMKKTETTDVYKLSLAKKIYSQYGKKMIKFRNIGIAYIPSHDTSIMCKKMFKTKKIAIVECKFDENKKKWIPIKESDKKTPDRYCDILSEKNDDN